MDRTKVWCNTKAIKVRIYPTLEQEQEIDKRMSLSIDVYNLRLYEKMFVKNKFLHCLKQKLLSKGIPEDSLDVEMYESVDKKDKRTKKIIIDKKTNEKVKVKELKSEYKLELGMWYKDTNHFNGKSLNPDGKARIPEEDRKELIAKKLQDNTAIQGKVMTFADFNSIPSDFICWFYTELKKIAQNYEKCIKNGNIKNDYIDKIRNDSRKVKEESWKLVYKKEYQLLSEWVSLYRDKFKNESSSDKSIKDISDSSSIKFATDSVNRAFKNMGHGSGYPKVKIKSKCKHSISFNDSANFFKSHPFCANSKRKGKASVFGRSIYMKLPKFDNLIRVKDSRSILSLLLNRGTEDRNKNFDGSGIAINTITISRENNLFYLGKRSSKDTLLSNMDRVYKKVFYDTKEGKKSKIKNSSRRYSYWASISYNSAAPLVAGNNHLEIKEKEFSSPSVYGDSFIGIDLGLIKQFMFSTNHKLNVGIEKYDGDLLSMPIDIKYGLLYLNKLLDEIVSRYDTKIKQLGKAITRKWNLLKSSELHQEKKENNHENRSKVGVNKSNAIVLLDKERAKVYKEKTEWLRRFHFKVASGLCKYFTYIFVEDLSVSSMRQAKGDTGKKVARKGFQDYSIASFVSILKQKASEYCSKKTILDDPSNYQCIKYSKNTYDYFTYVYLCDPAYTSKNCFFCKSELHFEKVEYFDEITGKKKERINDRKVICSNTVCCMHTEIMDRDINASYNILKKGWEQSEILNKDNVSDIDLSFSGGVLSKENIKESLLYKRDYYDYLKMRDI